MRAITFDTETTGLRPGHICQLAYIIEDGEQGGIKGANLFFSVDYIEPGAQNIHGFSVEELAELSCGRRFGDAADDIYKDFTSCDLWIAHNYAFDYAFIAAEFKRSGLATARPRRNFCTMRNFAPVLKLPAPPRTPWRAGAFSAQRQPRPATQPYQYKFPNLKELAEFNGIKKEEISAFANAVFGVDAAFCAGDTFANAAFGVGTCAIKSHDARYDCAAAYMCYKKAGAPSS